VYLRLKTTELNNNFLYSEVLVFNGRSIFSRSQCFLMNASAVQWSEWSSGRSSWLQIQRSGFNSRRYQIFREVVGTIEELLEKKKGSGFGLEYREYGSRDPLRWTRGTVYRKVGSNFADKRRSLGRYSWLADLGHRVYFSFNASSYVLRNASSTAELSAKMVSKQNRSGLCVY
jgi:hypothetical protein